ncbi:hypothetical protein CLF_100190 [Clonorchis sinensis]|uniref:Uncharacterized protein n=1 Tax=Clonorchis sinensis TaxID=79923 RepID=G7Y2W3_CLOSI|nr:hypothetical protein CLF_100190 [Clonorchis sinensis]
MKRTALAYESVVTNVRARSEEPKAIAALRWLDVTLNPLHSPALRRLVPKLKSIVANPCSLEIVCRTMTDFDFVSFGWQYLFHFSIRIPVPLRKECSKNVRNSPKHTCAKTQLMEVKITVLAGCGSVDVGEEYDFL